MDFVVESLNHLAGLRSEDKADLSQRRQPSLIGLTSSPALCLVIQDLASSSFQWTTIRFGSVSAAISRQNKTYPPHNAASLASRLKEAGKRGKCVAANHAPSAPFKALTWLMYRGS